MNTTSTDILERWELDAAVAREVMGWTCLHRVPSGQWVGFPPGSTEARPVPGFSSYFDPTWEVIEHFGSDYVSLTYAYAEVIEGEVVDGWWCEIVAPGESAREFAATVEVAICRAALAAVRARGQEVAAP